MTTTQTTLSSGTYDNVLAQVEALARRLEPHDYQSGTWLRELAVALAQHRPCADSDPWLRYRNWARS
jgi:hypothetical protein